MSIDVFGRRKHSLPNDGYKKTEDGDYDIENKRLCNVAPPRQKSDAVNLKSLDEYLRLRVHSELDYKLREIDERIHNVTSELSEKISKLEFEIEHFKTKTMKDLVGEAVKGENSIILTGLEEKIQNIHEESVAMRATTRKSADSISNLRADIVNLDTRVTGAMKTSQKQVNDIDHLKHSLQLLLQEIDPPKG